MSSKIRVLNDHTINQIAAGEVVEQPASVVKELVENALDASATSLQVDVFSGGRQCIRVLDDGEGMNSDDALLCLERHATSKLRNIDDLFALGTLGFRGEALPSIAAISKFSLRTKVKGSETGTYVLVEGGKILQKTALPCQEGTMIEVKDLFFNVPVRKKFQRSPAADFREILKLLQAFSLSHLDVNFLLNHDGKLQFKTPPSQGDFFHKLEERLNSVLGEKIRGLGSFFELESEGYHLKGWMGFPSFTRRNRTGQFLFVNGRYVNSPLISYAVKDGFGPMLPTDRYPLFALFLTVPKDSIDANVHPQKKEIRLHHEMHVKELCKQAVLKALDTPGITFEAPSIPWEYQTEEEPLKPKEYAFSWNPSPLEIKISPKESESFSFVYTPLAPSVLATVPGYFFLEKKGSKKGVFVVDQNAMQASVMISSKEKTFASQRLLTPVSLTFSLAEMSLLQENISYFESVGFNWREFGPNTLLIEAIPASFSLDELKEMILSFLDPLSKDDGRTSFVACFTSHLKRKNVTLSCEEAKDLTKRWFDLGEPLFSPKGEKVLVELEGNLLAKIFNFKIEHK